MAWEQVLGLMLLMTAIVIYVGTRLYELYR